MSHYVEGVIAGKDVTQKNLSSLRYPSSMILLGDFQLIFLYRV